MDNKMPYFMRPHDIDDLIFADADNYPDAVLRAAEPAADAADTRPIARVEAETAAPDEWPAVPSDGLDALEAE